MSLGQSLLMQSLFVSQFIGKFGRKVVLLFSQAKVGKIIILDNLLPSLETPLQYPGGLEQHQEIISLKIFAKTNTDSVLSDPFRHPLMESVLVPWKENEASNGTICVTLPILKKIRDNPYKE